MLKRYVATFFSLLLLTIVYLVSLLPLRLIQGKLDESTSSLLWALWIVIVAFSFILVWARIIKSVWFFSGTGEPVALEALQEQLMSVNAMPGPVQAVRKRGKIVFSWRYREMQWCELFNERNITRLYELHCRFDAATRTVVLSDRMRRAEFLICPDRIKTSMLHIPVPLLRGQSKKLASIALYGVREPYEYDFHPREIKLPVMGTIVSSGWNVRFSLF